MTTQTTHTLDPRLEYRDPWVSPRLKIAALWTSVLFVFAYVDLFSLYRADVRAKLEAGKVSDFNVGQGFLLGVTIFILIPSLMIALSLLLPTRAVRWSNLVVAGVYIPAILGSAIGDWAYYVLGSAIEALLLVAIIRLVRTWPRVSAEDGTERVEA